MGTLEEIEFTVTETGEKRKARLYVPADYSTSNRDYPLIVFLHGLGERGSDDLAQTRVGIYKAIAAHPERFPCLVLMPQCPLDRVWVELESGWAKGIPNAEAHIESALGATLMRYRVDESRIALTGLSMGGFGTLIHGPRNIERYRALVAVCGGGRTEDAPILARRPLWLLHGAADPLVPKDLSQQMHDAVLAAHGDVRITLYPGVGHNSWDLAYGDPEVVEFLIGAD